MNSIKIFEKIEAIEPQIFSTSSMFEKQHFMLSRRSNDEDLRNFKFIFFVSIRNPINFF